MWNLGNRDIIVLISVISGCAILCNVWGPLVALQIALVLVICGWFTLVVADDTLFTPHALLILDYIEAAGRELNRFLENIYIHAHEYFVYLSDIFKQLYRVHVVERMAQRRRSTYQLSSESYSTSRNPSRMSLVAGLSPIARRNYTSDVNSSNVENHPFASADTMLLDDGNPHGKVTSTPLVSWRKEEPRNGDIFGANHSGANKSPWSRSVSATLNHSQSRDEDATYSSEVSAWGTSGSPKMRSRAGGIKTVQTVAGPLLASTRYNIDPKVYSDVTSPGLTTRLTKYATEANTKLTHQSQYGTGQFPRVNLNCSPTPLISPKTGKMRMPVTVRVAPPENTRTNKIYEYSRPDRRKILSNICQDESKTPMSVVQVLREISLKRHASREDVTFELAKKQRTEGVFSDGLENLEEMTQKRTRDDSSRSDEEISPQNKSVRPAKRSKMPSCYDILSSLSSSINVSAGVKRKALDTSRSGTPDVGKHFKSLDSSHDDCLSPTITRTISEPTKPSKRALNELDTSRNSDIYSPHKKMLESIAQKGILKSPPASKIPEKSDDTARERFLRDVEIRSRVEERDGRKKIEEQEIKIAKETTVLPQSQIPVKLTDKLFMKAEPQNIDKLKTLIEEHGCIKPRFTTNDTDEIKKSDIVNMRQTSMKTRLKSMFDAISGKAPSKINPEVVIQAEEAKAPTSSSTLTASLTSLTSTTNVNTSPIATSAVVPIIGKAKPNTTPAKHVTFQFATTEASAKTSTETSAASLTETKVISSVSESNETKKITSTATDAKPAQNLLFQSFNTPSSTASVPAFSFGSSPLNTSSAVSSNATPALAAKTTSPVSLPSIATTTATSSPLQFNSSQIFNASTTSSALSGSATPVIAKTTISTLSSFNSPSQSAAIVSPTSGKFSGQGLTSGSTPSTNPSTPSFKFGNTTTTAPPAFGIATSSTFANASTPATTSAFSFGSNAPPQSTETKPFSFGGGAASTSQNTIGSITTSQSAPTSLATTTSSTGGFSFSSSASAPMKSNSLFGSVTTASSTPNPAFSNPASTASSFSFGSNATSTSKPTFSFGSNATTTAVTSPSTGSSISFGTPNNSVAPPAFGTTTSATTTASNLPSLFGTPSTTSAATTANNQPSIFGTPSTTAAATTASNQPNLFGTPATSASAFGTATTAPTFGTTSNQSAFSGTPNAFGTSKTMETPAFGMGAPPAFAATSTTSSLFSTASSNVPSTTAPPAFGSSSFGQTKPPPAFGATATNTFANAGGASTSLFGSQPTTTAAFGSATPASTVSTPMFGNPSTPAQSFGTPTTAPPPFGATNTSTTSFGAVSTAAPTFGTINTSTPAFGLQNTAAGTGGNQNCTSSVFSTTNPPAFGTVTTTAPPAFGASINSPSGFATSGFGATSNPPPAFNGGSSGFGGFGAGNNATSPFASQPTPGSTSFGTPSSTAPAFGGGNSGTSSFSFGGSQTSAQPAQQQQTPVFAFGGAAPANNAPGGSAPFQFGSSAPQPGGFNFSGAPSTPALNFSKDGTSGGSFAAPALGANSFNAPTTGGMFSIGSGSTGPRRPSRRRQR